VAVGGVDESLSLWDARNGVVTKFAETSAAETVISAGINPGSEVVYIMRGNTQVPYKRLFLESAPYGKLAEAMDTEVPARMSGNFFTANGWFGTHVPKL
jgi:hypothetical protein